MSLRCLLWGHAYRFDTADIGAAHDCRRCGHHVPAIEWPRTAPDVPCRKDDRGAYMPQGAGYQPDACQAPSNGLNITMAKSDLANAIGLLKFSAAEGRRLIAEAGPDLTDAIFSNLIRRVDDVEKAIAKVTGARVVTPLD